MNARRIFRKPATSFEFIRTHIDGINAVIRARSRRGRPARRTCCQPERARDRLLGQGSAAGWPQLPTKAGFATESASGEALSRSQSPHGSCRHSPKDRRAGPNGGAAARSQWRSDPPLIAPPSGRDDNGPAPECAVVRPSIESPWLALRLPSIPAIGAQRLRHRSRWTPNHHRR